MLKQLAIIIALIAVSFPVFAQAQQKSTTAIDRIAGSLAQCVSTAEQQLDQITDLQRQLMLAQARIKELEPKQETAPSIKEN